jgi:malate synthase
VTRDLVERVLGEECARLEGLPGPERAWAPFEQSALDDDFVDVLTLPAYAAVPAAEH